MTSILVTSANGANGFGYGAVLAFSADGSLIGPFSQDRRITSYASSGTPPRRSGPDGAVRFYPALMADELSQRYRDLLDGSYDCVDRIVLNGYFRLCYSGGGFREWWRRLMGTEEKLDNAHLMRMAGRFSRRIRGFARAHSIPVIDCRRGERKHEIAEEYLATHTVKRGLFLILVARAIAGETPFGRPPRAARGCVMSRMQRRIKRHRCERIPALERTDHRAEVDLQLVDRLAASRSRPGEQAPRLSPAPRCAARGSASRGYRWGTSLGRRRATRWPCLASSIASGAPAQRVRQRWRRTRSSGAWRRCCRLAPGGPFTEALADGSSPSS